MESCFGETVPGHVTCAPAENRGMVFTDDRGREYRFEQPGLNIWRSGFDHWLAGRAAARGARLIDGTAALACETGPDSVSVVMRGGGLVTERARYVLNCEGGVSALRRKLTGGRPDVVQTVQCFCEGRIELDPHYFYAYLQPELSGYDAWFNVKDGQLVLGVSAPGARGLPEYHRRFLAYMAQTHGLRIERELRREKWLMPRVRPGCPVDTGGGRILFAGETAGFLNPMGEGISAAIESGRAAAMAIDGHFDRPDRVGDAYREATRELHGYMARQWRFVARLAATFAEMGEP